MATEIKDVRNNEKRNTIQTVLSERAVGHLECILFWCSEEFDFDSLSRDLLQMLKIYVQANPNVIRRFGKPTEMIDRVSMILQLSEQLKEVVEMEEPLRWEEDNDHVWIKPQD
ncbi:MAG: hypothetical protein K2G93_00690 [Rikenella sp.]|nr:hypothetical protein [Rikenella sp.]